MTIDVYFVYHISSAAGDNTVVTPNEVLLTVAKSFWNVHAVSFASAVTVAKVILLIFWN